MARFPLPDDPRTRQELRAIYEEMGIEAGRLPSNFFSGMALRPDLLRGAWQMTRVMMAGRLPPATRELILTAVSAQNRAHFCCLSHAAQLKELGVPEVHIASVLSDPDLVALPEPDRGLIHFAMKVAREPNGVSVGDLQSLRALGHSEALLLEVVMLAAFANWSNTWSSAADILLD
jgi:uncharacterized peroxidase-related enzyme